MIMAEKEDIHFVDAHEGIDHDPPDAYSYPESVSEAIRALIALGFEVSWPNDKYSRYLNVSKFGEEYSVQSPDGGCSLTSSAEEAVDWFLQGATYRK
jgi:hypothetical protein